MTDKLIRYLCVVQLRNDSPIARVAADVPKVVAMLDRFSRGEKKEQAFRSNDGLLFGYFFKTQLPAGVMHHEFEQCDGTKNGDSFVVFEVGKLGAATGVFSRAATWLQRH